MRKGFGLGPIFLKPVLHQGWGSLGIVTIAQMAGHKPSDGNGLASGFVQGSVRSTSLSNSSCHLPLAARPQLSISVPSSIQRGWAGAFVKVGDDLFGLTSLVHPPQRQLTTPGRIVHSIFPTADAPSVRLRRAGIY